MSLHTDRLAIVALLATLALCGCMCTAHGLKFKKDAPRPHIFMVIVDDFGWAEVGYHRNGSYKADVMTPTIDELVADGIELNRHYVHYMCTPTRVSFQSGRLPVHVLQSLCDPCQAEGGIPRNMTGVAQHMQDGGYATHFVGKWDAGMATPTHTPKGRGYDSSLHYFGHANWMYTEHEWGGSENNKTSWPECNPPNCFNDFWDTDKPANMLNGTQYEEFIFRDRVNDIINAHDPSQPLFLTYASKVAHYPLQAPAEYQNKFSFIDMPNTRVYHAMVNVLDDNLANMTNLLKQKGMWNNTLMVLTSDNGGYVLSPEGPCFMDEGVYTCFNGEAGGNNYPLRGGKYSQLEGGIRVNAFVSGGFVPESLRGTRQEGIVHVADWYATFAALAGVDPTDHTAAASGLPPIDSLNMWPFLSGQEKTSPRTDILISDSTLISGDWKVLTGKVSEANWGGPLYPNMSTYDDPISKYSLECGQSGCLFNVATDPHERNDVAAENPQLISQLIAKMANMSKSIFPHPLGPKDPVCAQTAETKYGGFYGPWLELDTPNTP
eukprot:m.48939 g.48939  ORF g.48939 m.48939 type:complete len:549 (+) comp11071_c0_seq2:65-1711(+)